ncbi:Uncharacterised protein at_DN0204 [Pycnogonum litorale]
MDNTLHLRKEWKKEQESNRDRKNESVVENVTTDLNSTSFLSTFPAEVEKSKENKNVHVSKLIVRNEEIVIVSLVLFLWVSVIIIFINRWGRIRMLEPYLPDYKSPAVASSVSPTLPKRSSKISINIDRPSSRTNIATASTRPNLEQQKVFETPMFSSQIYLNRMTASNSGGVQYATKTRLLPDRSDTSACLLAIESFCMTRKTRSDENIPRKATAIRIHSQEC